MSIQKYIFFIGLLMLSCVCTYVRGAQPYTVVLDAGHGGKDPGAVGKFSKEKDLNLSLVLQMGKLMKEQYPDVKVIYTRSTDVFIPLQTRADIANKNNADLFISIHANASESKDAKGVETFILGTEKMDKNLDVAMRENAVMKLESDYKTTYQGFDPNSIDSYIMFELMQNSYMDQSLQLAEQVQQRFVGHLNRSDRGVQQASFWVLLKSACPSILFEMGFISNAEEEKYLNRDSTMYEMAQALVNAFGAYTHRQAVKKETLTIESDPIAMEFNDVNKASENAVEEVKGSNQKSEVKSQDSEELTKYFAVQICASKTPLEASDPRLKGMSCECIKVGDWYKYYTAVHTDRSQAVAAQKELKTVFPDCWVITFEK